MRSLLTILMGIAAVGLLVTFALMVSLGMRRDPTQPRQANQSTRADQPDQGLEGMVFPEFSLIGQDAQPRSHELLEGHYTIVDFIFTYCPMACPAMTGRMAQMQDTLKDTGVRFASFTLDPANDTPEKLRDYATAHGADLATWTFLTGDRDAIWRIVTDHLHFGLAEDPSFQITLPDNSTMANIQHSTRFILVGPDRQVLGLYESTSAEQMAMLENRIRELTRPR